MNAKTNRFFSKRAAVIPLLLAAVSMQEAQACDLPWQPTSATYQPPARPGNLATLVLGPDVCVLYYDPSLAPPSAVVTVSGQTITITANLWDLSGIGVSPPPHPVEIPIAVLPQGEYRLLTRLTLWGSGFPVPNADLPFSVSAGTVAAIPISRSWLLFGIGIVVLLTAGYWFRRMARLVGQGH